MNASDANQQQDLRNRTSVLLYLTPLILGPVLLLVVALAVLPSEWNVQLGGGWSLIGLGYGTTLHKADCQIVVFGDSTGMIGINPAQLSAQTGLSSCNISEVEPVQVVNGQATLDRYLAQNTPPRYLVMMQSPDAFDPRGPTKHQIGEGITYLMRRPELKPKIVFALTHAPDVFRWMSAGLDLVLRQLRGRHLTQEQLATRDRTHGQLSIDDPTAIACIPAPAPVIPDRKWVQSIRDQYSRNGTRVFVDAMPVPDCDPDLKQFRSMLAGVIDNRVDTLPLNDYYIGGRHVGAEGSKALTSMVAAQVCAVERSKTCGAS